MAVHRRLSASPGPVTRPTDLPVGIRYLIAALVTGAALLLRLILDPIVGAHALFSTLYPAIAFLALFFGAGPALMCTAVGLISVPLLFVLPRGALFATLDYELAAEYLVVAALLIVEGEISKRSRNRAEQAEVELMEANDELERKVERRTRDLVESLGKVEKEVCIRREAEKHLSELSAHLMRLQDEERRRIARDLHDSTGQTLTALKLTLSTCESLIPNNTRITDLFCDLHALADQALGEIRTTSHLLHPPLLDEVGFSSAAKWYMDEFAKRSGIEVSLAVRDVPALPKTCELVLFRVLQESLTNVLRHSGSSSVEVVFECDRQGAFLTVNDHGRGIAPEKLNAFRETGAGVGVGLGGMKQRLRELGGQLEIGSGCNGTSVKAWLPIVFGVAGASAAD